jgi:hypothetical protein
MEFGTFGGYPKVAMGPTQQLRRNSSGIRVYLESVHIWYSNQAAL